MKSVRKSVLLFAFVWTLGCSNKPTTNPSASPPARVENAPLGDEVQDDAAASSAKSEVIDSGVVIDRSRLCGRFGDLSGELLEDGKLVVNRGALLRSIERFVEEAKRREKWFEPPPAKTKDGEEAYAMLWVGENATCGFVVKDYLVRVNGKLLSNPDERMAVYSSLSSVSTLEVEIQRAGKPLTLVYLVRD